MYKYRPAVGPLRSKELLAEIVQERVDVFGLRDSTTNSRAAHVVSGRLRVARNHPGAAYRNVALGLGELLARELLARGQTRLPLLAQLGGALAICVGLQSQLVERP